MFHSQTNLIFYNINCNVYLLYKKTCFYMSFSPSRVSLYAHTQPMMLKGYSHGLSKFIPYTKRNRRESDMYQLCGHVINRSVITTCRLLHTYECITLLLINLPGTYFSITNSSATLNSCHFSSFYRDIDSNMPRSANICSFQPVSGMHIAQRTT